MKSKAKIVISCLLLALLLLPWPLLPFAKAEDAAGEVTAQCAYTIPDNLPSERLTDSSLLTRMTIRGGRSVSVNLPACTRPSLYMTWFSLPGPLTVLQKDEKGKQIKRAEVIPGALFERYELEAACRTVILSSDGAWTVSSLRVFDGELPEDLMYFGAPMEQADMLVLLGQPQALFEELGGLVPLYTGKYEMKTAFCFLSEDSGVLQATAGDPLPLGEALGALWFLGYKEAPFLGGFLDHDYNELEDVRKTWTENIW